ncbi:MAG TPA: c-type cytochrome domain-containing protein [Verrucomicrobiae bacterium]|nr:c-type cytochrome domain-containing protein [Verrucomicrobiae bacterium]
MKYRTLSIAITTAFALSLIAAPAEDKKFDDSKLPPASSQQGITYEKDIKPIFEKSCVKCHSGQKAKGKLHLDSLEGAVKGGKEGPEIIPGKGGQSSLVYAVAHIGDEDDFMPPPKNKANISQLTKEQVGLIRAWIDQGAK